MTTINTNSHLLTYVDALTLLAVALLLWGGHYFRWHIIPAIVEPDGKRELKRVVAYAYGTGCIWLGAAAYIETRRLMGLPPVITLESLTLIMAAAGFGTVLPRIVEGFRDLLVKSRGDL